MHIKVENISKIFEMASMEQLVSFWHILLGTECRIQQKDVKIAVDNVSFEISEGERVGIIGNNGAGKSTLLQMIAGLASPSSGYVEVEGHVDCIMTLGIGIREELTGLENIYVDGEINNKSRKKIDKVMDDIIEFAELGEFINYPVRTYSSGMKARLAFAMIIFIDPEILIVDEALSAGDYRFSQKASQNMEEICRKGKIFILVAHSMGAIVAMCNRCIWLDAGKVMMDGSPDVVTKAYLEHVKKSDGKKFLKKFNDNIGFTSFNKGVEFTKLELSGGDKKSSSIFDVNDDIIVHIGIEIFSELNKPDIRIVVERVDGVIVIDNSSSIDGYEFPDKPGRFELTVLLNNTIRIGKQTYQVSVEVTVEDSLGERETAAIGTTVLRIENNIYPHENPVSWIDPTWHGLERVV